jgi:polyisoprenoid-binding protein YceI
MSRMILAVSIFILTFAATAHAENLPPGLWVSSADSVVKYHVFFSLHDVHGVSKAVEARARLKEDLIELQVRIPTASFDSGNKNRDANAHDSMRAGRHPLIEFKATGTPCRFVAGSCTFAANGELSFGGVKRPYSVPVTLTRSAGDKVAVDFKFPVVLSQHELDRPKLLFLSVEDSFDVQGNLIMERQP